MNNTAAKTHFLKTFDSNYINAGDFQPGEDKHVTISDFKESVEVVGQGNQKSHKPCIFFAEDLKPLVLNKTNAKSIKKALGSPFMEDWVGKRITLFVQSNVKAFGDTVDAIRVRPRAPKATKPGLSAERFDNMLQSIKSGQYSKEQALTKFSLTAEQSETLAQL